MPRNRESMFCVFLIYGSVMAGSKRGVVDGNGMVASIPNLATLMFWWHIMCILCAFENHYDCSFSSSATWKRELRTKAVAPLFGIIL